LQSSLAPKNSNSIGDGSVCDVRASSPEVATPEPEIVTSSCSSVATRVAVDPRDGSDEASKTNCDVKRDDGDETSLKNDAFQSSYAISAWSSTSSVATR
jgi:hypothetical protein